MIPAILTMILVLVVCAGIVGVVAIGMAGRGRLAAPRLARLMERTAHHLNGDGEPPKALVKLLD